MIRYTQFLLICYFESMRDLKREMEFEGLIMSDHKCEISVLPYSRLGRLTYPKVSSIIISVYAKGNHPEL